ncbi:MAG: OmpH family outer membrane protein [Lentisphaerae bacterium]|nr:OmpH family outer membrane protein [Lentisphaerota bacterium]
MLGELQRQLQELELELFVGVMNEVSAELTKISIREKYDIVLDKSGFRAGAPVTIVAYASSALDITDELVAAVKGIKKEVNETGADFSEEGAVETEFPLTLPGTVN